MADAGIARSDGLLGGTLTRADLSDIVHNRLGLSRAESANVVERVRGVAVADLAGGVDAGAP